MVTPGVQCPSVGHVSGLGVLPFNLSHSVKNRQNQDIHAGIIDQASVELIKSLTTAEPVRTDVVVEPRSKVGADGETTSKDCQVRSLSGI
jgi:hypothetical protein